ncbi:MAG TPA: ATP-dependent protease ATPase subunit HslU [Acidobacteriota bacterium]|nr:ATP-dependent protease ATPase subunit HslU [Acidobacteriota bacterium]HNT17832.1 ATP-dependent protease ATPase subunit HslU [Acidobacteriota bacterium]
MIKTETGNLTAKLIDPLVPKKIVEELDRYIVKQDDAKKAVAIALRNRVRRQALEANLREEVAPKNIIMIGPTGVGKTEIARRLAKLTKSPFLKVEASKFTEVGYVGKDVESMIRDLTEISYNLVRSEMIGRVKEKAKRSAEERLLDLLLPKAPTPQNPEPENQVKPEEFTTRDKLKKLFRDGMLDEKSVEIEVASSNTSAMKIFSNQGMEEMGINLRELMPGMFDGGKKRRKMKVKDAYEQLIREEEEKLIDQDEISREALERAEQSGIIFVDEIDKIAGRSSGSHGPDVSREGVQRDLLPIVEGTRVMTRYGLVRTDHILFIAAGAFHMTKPADLLPELQGRFPIRVELQPLTEEDFLRILKEPENALLKQYTALLATEGVETDFTEDAIEALAKYAQLINDKLENIGARRLHTVMEKVMEEVSFNAPELAGMKVTVDRAYVDKILNPLVENQDLSKYIL